MVIVDYLKTRRVYFLKVSAIIVIITLPVWVFLKSGYQLGIDVQKVVGEPSCLPYRLLLIKMIPDYLPSRHHLIVAKMPPNGYTVGAREGMRLVKYVRGIPGDHIRVHGTELWINDEHVDRLWLAKSIPGKTVGDFDADYILEEDEYFLMGTTHGSFDSRYWGPIHADAILGPARPLF